MIRQIAAAVILATALAAAATVGLATGIMGAENCGTTCDGGALPLRLRRFENIRTASATPRSRGVAGSLPRGPTSGGGVTLR